MRLGGPSGRACGALPQARTSFGRPITETPSRGARLELTRDGYLLQLTRPAGTDQQPHAITATTRVSAGAARRHAQVHATGTEARVSPGGSDVVSAGVELRAQRRGGKGRIQISFDCC